MSALNLVLLLAVVRRLDQLSRDLTGDRTAVEEDPLPTPGTAVGGFATVTLDGEPLSRADLSGRTLVGFFSTGCAVCEVLAPRFRSFAAAFPGGRERVLAIVAGVRGEAAEPAGLLREAARVVAEPFGGPVAAAFGVTAFPIFFLVEDGVVAVVAMKPEGLRLPEPARTGRPKLSGPAGGPASAPQPQQRHAADDDHEQPDQGPRRRGDRRCLGGDR
jgi:thiol-disulfide isomerase/thioredoxin